MSQGSRRQPAGLSPTLAKLNRCLVVGVLNVTPDSFSDGGLFSDTNAAVKYAQDLIQNGADLIDVGGESTRPGASRITTLEEQKRVIPVIKELTSLGIITSIDTMNSETALVAVNAGAQMVNDVSGGLADENMHKCVADLNVPYVLMHWRGHSTVMDNLATYSDVVTEVVNEIQIQVDNAIKSGIDRNKIVIDPGLGFAKNPEHNWEILKKFNELHHLNLPIYIGASRKRFLTDFAIPRGSLEPKDRDIATSIITSYVSLNGAWAVRVHDVSASSAAVKIMNLVKET
ncbi:MAG: dihydropteroate synthase [Candidatus Nanopelagicales bacterium]|nr:dihydropteroate synthase [Candidatus Nanopelagicales bacterium]